MFLNINVPGNIVYRLTGRNSKKNLVYSEPMDSLHNQYIYIQYTISKSNVNRLCLLSHKKLKLFYPLALFRDLTEEYLCTLGWATPNAAVHNIAPPTIKVQEVCRTVGSGLPLKHYH